MQLIKCAKGHYFDRDKYTRCPYCNDMGNTAGVTVPMGSVQTPKTVPQKPKAEVREKKTERRTVEQKAASKAAMQAEEAKKQAEEIFEMWQAAQSSDKAGASYSGEEDDNRTVSYYSKSLGVEPVVGWLVAIGGEYFGEAFQLKSGRNCVGRSPEMDIQLNMDFSVSRRKHAIIIYEPKSRVFIAQPGESRELFYLNDEVVLNNTVMKAYDVLSIGETRLLFLPLCGERFNWEDAKKEK